MFRLYKELNDEQLDGLANVSFDIAKASFILALLPTQTDPTDIAILITKTFIGLLLGVVFTSLGLLLLGSKKRH